MKKIFDWMREQMKDRSEVCYRSWLKCRSDEDYGCSFAYSHAIDLINEAEAKWEANCCEWKPTLLHNHDRFSNCMVKFDELHRQDVECFSFCPYCGKPIKISEVD